MSFYKFIGGLFGLAAVLVVVAAIRTPGPSGAGTPPQIVADLPVDPDILATHLAKALTFPTESSFAQRQGGSPEFEGFIAWIAEAYPLVHANLNLERVNTYSLLYTWQGSDVDARPILLAGHYDVVPGGSDADRANWDHPPFAGVIQDGVIYGRGALDDKPNVIGLLEATEYLLSTGFMPKQTIYLAFGHDEEISGPAGATKIAELLQARNVSLEFVLDEGGVVTTGETFGISKNAAAIGLAEKGFYSIELFVDNTGPTHSSMPMMETPIGILGRAIIRLEENQMPASITSVVGSMMDAIAPEMAFTNRMALTNRWLFGPLIVNQFQAEPQTNAAVRTTTAPTMISGSAKENALPATARALINFRILPGDTTESVLAHVRRVISDPRVRIEEVGGNDPSSVSTVESEAYATISATIGEVFENTVAVPYLVMGGTDARHYAIVSDNQYRFSPMFLRGTQGNSFHGLNERQNVADFANVVKWYATFIGNLNGQD
jgi:carboxypeptidase PM20D1